ncbi:MAG: hypothetical protein QXH75_05285 [Sulfolobaceae archaeon]
MPKGKLVLFDEGGLNGSIDYQSFTKTTKLNYTNKEATFPIDVLIKPCKFYLIIQIKREKDYLPRWRVWLDNFSLTKEFKPNFEAEIDDSYILSTIIYDLTPIIKEGKHEITISHPSIRTISILNVSTVTFYEIEGFNTKYKLAVGPLILNAHEKITLPLLDKSYFVIKNEGKSSILKLLDNNGGIIYNSTPSIDSDEVEVEGKNVITAMLESSNEKDYGVILSAYSITEKVPNIKVSVESKIDGSYIILNLKNESEVDLDKLILNIMINGIQAHYKSFNNIKVNSSFEFRVPLQSAQNKKSVITIRVVGIKGGYRHIVDKQINL